jgi:hypothetical protein
MDEKLEKTPSLEEVSLAVATARHKIMVTR